MFEWIERRIFSDFAVVCEIILEFESWEYPFQAICLIKIIEIMQIEDKINYSSVLYFGGTKNRPLVILPTFYFWYW